MKIPSSFKVTFNFVAVIILWTMLTIEMSTCFNINPMHRVNFDSSGESIFAKNNTDKLMKQNTNDHETILCTGLSDNRVYECLHNLRDDLMEHIGDECTSGCLVHCCVSARFSHCMEKVKMCRYKMNSLLSQVYGSAYTFQSNITCTGYEYSSGRCFLYLNDFAITIVMFIFFVLSLLLVLACTLYHKLSSGQVDSSVTSNTNSTNESSVLDANENVRDSVCYDDSPASPPPTYAKALIDGHLPPPPSYDEARVNQLSSHHQLPHVIILDK